MKFLLMTTSIVNKWSIVNLERMIDSVSHSAIDRNRIHHIVLLQNFSSDYQYFIDKYANVVRFLVIPEIVSLSKARNKMLDTVNIEGLLPLVDIVAFPDDDCWYPKGFLAHVANQFSGDLNLDFYFCNYSSTPTLSSLEGKSFRARTEDVVQNVSSNTQFLRSGTVSNIGGFDENLGVGTANNGGEDLDYALKAFLIARKVKYSPNNLVGHRNKDNNLRAKYFRGSYIVLRRFAFSHPGLCIQYIRKILVGIVLILRGDMSIKSFWRVG